MIHHRGQIAHDPFPVRHLGRREPVPAKNDRRNLLQRLPISRPRRYDIGLNAANVLGVFQAVLDKPRPRRHLMRPRRVIARADED